MNIVMFTVAHLLRTIFFPRLCTFSTRLWFSRTKYFLDNCESLANYDGLFSFRMLTSAHASFLVVIVIFYHMTLFTLTHGASIRLKHTAVNSYYDRNHITRLRNTEMNNLITKYSYGFLSRYSRNAYVYRVHSIPASKISFV